MAATKQRASETMRRASFVVLAFCLMFASFRWNVFGIDRAAVAGTSSSSIATLSRPSICTPAIQAYKAALARCNSWRMANIILT